MVSSFHAQSIPLCFKGIGSLVVSQGIDRLINEAYFPACCNTLPLIAGIEGCRLPDAKFPVRVLDWADSACIGFRLIECYAGPSCSRTLALIKV